MSVDVTLVVGAYAWSNWVRYEISADFTTPADAWTFEVHNPTLAQLAAVETGQVVTVLVNELVALKGILERRTITRNRQSGTVLTLSGRDMAGPLVDCMPPASWTWRNLSLAGLASKALNDLGLDSRLVFNADAGEIRSLQKVEPGETYWQIIERYCKKLRLIPWMAPDGRLHLTRPDYTSEPVATLYNGRTGALAAATNVLESAYTEDLAGRASDLTVIGQAKGSDSLFGEGACRLSGSAQDAGVLAKGLYRPLVVDEGELASTLEANARAAWEVSHRQYMAESLEYAVPGHGPDAESLWAVNTQVSVQDEVAGQYGTWWIAARQFTRDRQGGTRTRLTLRRPNTLLPAVAS